MKDEISSDELGQFCQGRGRSPRREAGSEGTDFLQSVNEAQRNVGPVKIGGPLILDETA